MRNEADTRSTLIDPRLRAAGWIDTQVSGIITIPTGILVGDRIRRGEAPKSGYFLHIKRILLLSLWWEAKLNLSLQRLPKASQMLLWDEQARLTVIK
jgi:type I site-specific restriction endonuclease